MSRYIDADKLSKHLRDERDGCSENAIANPIGYGTGLGLTMAIAYAETLSTADVVEVVRCKDCIHWGGVAYGFICRKFSGLETKVCMGSDHYCSYGERIEK